MEWQLVPKEPTPKMLKAYAEAWFRQRIKGCTVGEIAEHEYRAMLAAAPTPPPDATHEPA